jgi:hypothetical protein
MSKGGKIIRPDGTVANGRKKLADPKDKTKLTGLIKHIRHAYF